MCRREGLSESPQNPWKASTVCIHLESLGCRDRGPLPVLEPIAKAGDPFSSKVEAGDPRLSSDSTLVLWCTHTVTYAHTNIRTDSQNHTQSQTHIHACTCTRTLTHTKIETKEERGLYQYHLIQHQEAL